MHVENELVEFVIAGDQEYKEIVEEEILVPEEVPEPSLTDFADTAPAQGKPWCITLVLDNHCMYMYIYIYTHTHTHL
jgi:hypothetical protein